MSLKQFKIIKIFIVTTLAIIVARSVVMENFIVPIIALALSIAVLFLLRSRVKEIIADERDQEIGRKAAMTSMRIFYWIALAATFIFLAKKGMNPSFEYVAYTIAYTVCFLLILYSVIFHVYLRK